MRATPRAMLVPWIVLAFVPAAELSAQTGPQAPLDERRYAGWVFTPSIAAGAGYDDNVLLANRANNAPSDYTSPVTPSATLDFTGRRTRFSTGYTGSLTFYRSVDELTNFQHLLRATLSHRVTPRLSIVAEENFSKAPTTDALELAGIPFYRVGSRTNTLAGGVDAALNKYTTLATRYSLRTVAFDFDELAQRALLGGHSHEGNISFARALSTRLTVTGRYSYQRGTAGEAARVSTALDRGSFEIQSGGVEAAYRLTEFVNVTGGVGVARMAGTEPLVRQDLQLPASAITDSPFDPEVGPTFLAGVTWHGEHHLASLVYQRSFIPSFGFGGTFQNEEWVANLRVPFARNRAYAEASASWFNNEPLIKTQPTLRSMWLSGKAGYRVTRWLNVEGYYDRSQQDAQVAGGTLDRNQLGIRMVATRPMRLR